LFEKPFVPDRLQKKKYNTMKFVSSVLLIVAVGSSNAFVVKNNNKHANVVKQSSARFMVPPPLTSTAAVMATPGQLKSPKSPKKQSNDDKDINKMMDFDVNEPPKPGAIAKMLPTNTFDIDTPTSLFYFAVDFLAVVASVGFLDAVVTSDIYHSLPVAGQALCVAPLQVLAGFSMWCMWCIGHDAGHSTVSKKKWINRVVGEISHSMFCLTPFRPWQRSHRKHHLGHNHLTRDYSHQWFIKEERDSLHPLIKASHATRNFQLPILYLVYLLVGVPDGGHVFFYGRMWEGDSLSEKLNSAISVAVSMTFAGTLWANMGTADFTVVCMVPWLVMSFWLFMVTYLQHHSDDGKLYTDDTFTFERGAFETVDRNYGTWINRMSHHMMDGHVIHHLFFEKVPHYRLEKATEALVKGMEERNQGHLYKHIDTPDFTQEIIKQFNDNWFFINEEQIVRK
jgi:omega-3 fatty acid desaturase (delta-15 desaturase)